MSYVTSLYHVVFSTRNRQPVIGTENKEHLYRVIAAQIKEMKSKALIINGMQDHIHILLSLSPQVALSKLMRDIKAKSSVWAKSSGLFPLFQGWEKEYGAFSLSANHKEAVYDYIKDQGVHHDRVSLENEFERLVMKAGLTFYRQDAAQAD
ncbi:MAG: IS200/IS605 family transposase [Muribaculaceae bacterium]|nr:IS200/IS605 family transposase [Muribaculaceae bacterium]